jgi:hypothetical protein
MFSQLVFSVTDLFQLILSYIEFSLIVLSQCFLLHLLLSPDFLPELPLFLGMFLEKLLF